MVNFNVYRQEPSKNYAFYAHFKIKKLLARGKIVTHPTTPPFIPSKVCKYK